MPSYVVVDDATDIAELSVLALYCSETAEAEFDRVTFSTGVDWRCSIGLAATIPAAARMMKFVSGCMFVVCLWSKTLSADLHVGSIGPQLSLIFVY